MESLSLTPTPTPSPSLHPHPSNSPSHLPLPPQIKKSPPKGPKPIRSTNPSTLPVPLHTKNPHIIARHITSLSRLNKLPEALTILDYLDHHGIPLGPTPFAALLSASARLRSLPFTRQLHSHLRIHRLDSNEFLLHRLVLSYSASGSPADALSLLRASTDVYAWNALLKGSVLRGGRWSLSAFEHFDELRRNGIAMNEYTFSCLLKSLAGSPAFVQGTKTHAMLIKQGFYDASPMLKTGLIDMYFKCGRVKWAWKVFDEMRERDVVAWGAMIAGFGHNGLRREALEYFRWMVKEGVEVNSVVITSILPVIGELADINLGKEVHGHLIKRFPSFKKMVFVQSGLIDMYCKCGDMVSGRHVFYGTTGRNVVSWTALMSGYASNGRFEQALRSIIWMRQEGIKPDVVTMATALPVCTKLKALKQGKEIHGYSLKNWFVPNSSIETSLMTMYSECGMLDLACRVFDSMRKKNVIAWTSLIDSHIKNGRLIEALDVFRSMRLVHYNPDAVALGRVLSISGDLRASKLGKEVHGQVYKLKLESTPFLVGEIVRMYGKSGDMKCAKKVFDGVHAKGSLTCTAIIEAFGYNGRFKEAVELFHWMQYQGFVPNHFTFDAILAICERAGFVDEALDIFESMVRKYKVNATEEHCSWIIGLLSRAGRGAEAQKFIYMKSTLGYSVTPIIALSG